MSARHWENFLYVAAGLCVIFIFWSRSIIHTLTLIKWPLEFGHNFFYIACALGESILFSRLDSPLPWFQLSAAYAGIVWLLFIYDMRLIRARIADSKNAADRTLYARARTDQLLNIWVLVPLLFLLNLGCAFSIWNWPDLFIARAGHICLISIQLASFIGYLIYIGRHFRLLHRCSCEAAKLLASIPKLWCRSRVASSPFDWRPCFRSKARQTRFRVTAGESVATHLG
jgi:hypothetical protein